MKCFHLLKADMRSQKGSLAGIFMLVLIITVSLCAVLAVWSNSNAYEREQIDRIGYGDVSYWLAGVMDRAELAEQAEALEEVDRAEMEEILIFNRYYIGGQTLGVEGSLHLLDVSENAYPVFDKNLESIVKTPEKLRDGEIYAPASFRSLYDMETGDVLRLVTAEGEEEEIFTIKGFFEDPMAGSAMMGLKQILMTGTDMRRLAGKLDRAGEAAQGLRADVFHIFQAQGSPLSSGEFQKILNEKTDLSAAWGFSYSKDTIMGFMLILHNIFAGFLLVFVMILLVVAMIVIGHSIGSGIEQNYVDMGILKAIGYTRNDLRLVRLLQYLIVIAAGMLSGLPVSALAVREINRLSVTVTGILAPSDIPLGSSLSALGLILLVFMGFICMKTVKIGKISPIRAIRGGAEDVYFQSRFLAPIRKGGLSFWLAYRQLVSGKKQYISACLVASLLVFFLSLTARMDAWLGPGGKGLMDSFAASRYDLGVECGEEETAKEAEAFIAERAGIAGSYQFRMSRASVCQIEYLLNIISEPEYFNMLAGRACLYRNEIVITQMLADELHIGIGDTVPVAFGGKELDFLISGIYQCANDMGENFGISREGFRRLLETEDEESSYYTFYLLQDASMAEEISQELQEIYGEKLSVDENTWSGTDSILLVLSSLMVFMYAITIVFVLITVTLTGSRILYKEQQDMGVYKSLGYGSGRLRLAFALRFGIVSAAGSALGVLLSAVFTDPLATAMLRMCGISRFTSSLGPLRMAFPAAVVSAVFLFFAYFAAGRVKKVEPGILIVE
ncbi:MAG: ABC transporter permease [Blautia sp.]|nr:ABC transporter permease [Blautia sp.]MCM1200311.1 ABC transporter permease [Bacteroides fragilis]